MTRGPLVPLNIDPGGFRALSPQRAVSDEGVEIVTEGRYHIRYRWQGRSFLIDRDPMIDDTGAFGSILYLGVPPRWDMPYRHERLDEDDLARIKTQLFEAFAAFGQPLEIHEYPRTR